MKICSWNVNGIRAVLQKGFLEWVSREKPDILCLQEVKAFETQIPVELRFFLQDYQYIWHAGQRPGYSGVATFWKKSLDVHKMKSNFADVECFYEDGRVVEIEFSDFVLLNIYFPNG
jgi:exodeoxyribonuclease III